MEYLSKNNIREDIFVEKIIEITNQKDSIQKFVDYFESIIKGLSKPEQLIVDLSNGTALQKNVFSIAAYILDIKEQYLIDISKLFYDTENIKFFNEHKKSVIFAGGDSILFKGFFKQHELEEIKEIYKKSTKRSDPSGSGLTCSIGYGRTLTETYLALKIAKTQPGKNSIFGFKLADKGISKR